MRAILQSKRYSMHEVARLLNVHIATVWRWCMHGVRGRRLGTVLVGARRYVLAEDLDAFLAAGNQDRRADGADLHRRADDASELRDGLGVSPIPSSGTPAE
jgi:hypothetical protein